MLRNLIQAALKTRKRSKRRGRGRSSAGGAQANRLLFESLEPRVLLEGYTALQRPTELQYWDTAKADNGYNFYGVGGTSYLLDMEGKVVHTWPIGNNPHLLSNGGILDATTNDPSGFGGFKEVSWEGTTVWSYTETRSTYHPHHDFTRIYNPKLNAYTTLYIANKDLTYDQLVAAGANPATAPSTGAQMDAIVEVDASGTIVWEWCFFDHLVQDYSAAKSNYVGTGKTIADYPNKLDINLDGHNLKADWLHCNSLDYNQTLDQIVVNSVQGEFYVIDHGNTFTVGDPTASIALAATGAGDFLYRFGDPARYDQGTKPAVLEDWTQSTTGTKQMGGAHDIQWIADGLTGAGHFLIFNNAEYLSEHTSQSYVMEIDPFVDASGTDTGHYVNPPAAGYNTVTPLAVTDKAPKLISKQVVWNYSTDSNLTLFSQIGCSAQRLPNGNTLITADTEGYIMEVTPTGETVWDYIVPVTSSGTVQTIGDRLPMVNSIFRAYRYEATYFSGRTLTPGATIAGRTTVANPYAGTTNYDALQRQTETQYWDATNAYSGYTLFSAQGTTYLLDMQGRKVNTWATGTDARLLDSGNLLDWATNSSSQTGLKELDWSGNTVWQYYETRTAYHPHGDFQRIYDPKLGAYATLYLANKDVTAAECLAAGCDPADAPFTGAQVDTIVEVDMSGNIVWEWSFWDHAIQNVDATKANSVASGKTIADYPGKINLNLPGRPLQSNWLDCNSLDFNQTLNQIVVNSRQGEFTIIDHGATFLAGNPTGSIALAATTAGDFLYRFGDPARYSQGSAPSVGVNWETASSGNKQIGGSSNVQWIDSGLTGAGHLLVFNNNQYLYQRTPQSYVFEINPYVNSSGTDTGSYVNPPTAGYNTWTFDKDTMKANQLLSKQVVWKYGSISNLTMFSHFGSSAQRLPNGNTLICATTEGYLVEVDTSGNVVWEYINPVTNAGIVTAIGDDLPMTNAVPRAVRYAASFAGFTGHSLTPGATITGNVLPTITSTTRTPTAPSATNAVWVTSQMTDNGSISSAKLTYVTGSGTPITATPFTETFGTTTVKPWTGTTGSDNTWTIVGTPNPFELATRANYVTSTTAEGVEYKCSVATSASVSAVNSINAAGASGSVEFYVQTSSIVTTDGWAFQLDSGSGYVTRLSETGTSHTFTKFTYALASSELVAGLKMRFQFTGTAGSAGRIDLDQITVTTVSGGSSTSTVTMLDDGLHGDGAAGDHVYGGQIPAQALGTTVSYYVSATDNSGFTTVDPATAPTDKYSYTVTVQNNTAPTVATAASATPSPVTGTTTALAVLGADADTGESSLTYTWTATTVPSGATAPTFSVNGSNAAKATTATFSQAGSYRFTVTIADPSGLSATSPVDVTVNQTLTTIVVSPASVNLNTAATQQFTASGKDQFTSALTTQPTFTWSTTVTGGTISSSGLFTAPSTAASGKVTAANSSVSGESTVVVASLSHPYTMAALPDTGQVASYATIYGEDADYTINPPTYKDNGNGTVTDKVTGLIWQQVDGGEMTWEQAVAYADGLTLGGASDWRLPFGKELYSLMDEGTINPALNTTYFPASAAEYWWSSDTAVDDASKVWVANAGGGIGPHPKTETISAGGIKHFHVRCVRDPAATGATHLYGNLTNKGDGTVTDNHTSLAWQQAESVAMTWEEAQAYAENLTLAGHSDWRLPNIKELQSLSDTDFRAPSLDKTYFPGATATRYWSSTTMANNTLQAWYLDSDYGLTSYDVKTGLWHVRCVRGGTVTNLNIPEVEVIPAGSFVMGDHFNFSDPDHPSDELPLHTLSIDAFYMGTYDITNRQYVSYLNSALAQSLIEVRNGLVYAPGGSTIYAETRQGESALFGLIYSGIDWNGTAFSVLSGRENHPVVGIRWEGAAAYCNWLSAVQGYQSVYNLTTWTTDFTKSGYRLPTEAEWEYAANGGQETPYYQFPWGSNTNTDGTWSNWENSGDPYETGDYPYTTPVGFYDGTLQLKSEFNWPGSQTSYQTSNAVNGYGLYDMGGNIWQWTNDWYANGYYSVSPASNPTGPTTGDPMPDGLAYHGMRGGNWYNGAQYLGLSRISNRDPGYYRGPQDPNHPYYHVGFRVALKTASLVQPGATDQTLLSTLQFGEGPATDSSGNVFFSDVKANTIYKWSAAGQLSTFRTSSGGTNGLAFDASGNLIACEGTNGRIVSITPQGVVTSLASTYNGTRFNEPNDLWIDPSGGIYFTDPVFFGTQVQDGQHVYYISPDHSTVTRVISDMTKPNGLIGTADGKTLYVSDYGAGATYKYTIGTGGALTGKTLFVSVGSDGMELDSEGNVYLTTDDVLVYNAAGTKIATINVLERPTNLTFAGIDRRTLFITTEAALYTLALRPQGLGATIANAAPGITGTTRTPTIPSATDAVWVTSTVTDDSGVASVKLTYVTGSGTGTTTTPFTETLGTTPVKPWTGVTGSTNAWTVTGNYVELRTGANYVTSTTECGLEYKGGATLNAVTEAMMTTTNAINAADTSGSVEFWVQTLTLDGTDGWTFQVDSGSGFVTRLSELTGNSHAFQKYTYTLASSELVSTLKLRFQFVGGGAADDDRINLDQITVSVTTGSVPVTVTMLDDGAHGDGAASDHVYGGQIPAMAIGTTVSYYVTATDGTGLITTDPSTAPTNKYSYIVGHTTPTLQLNEFLASSTTFIATTDYPTPTVGLSINTTGALDGYTLLDPMHGKTTYLIDNAGQIVHTWTSEYEPGRTAYLMPDGHLFRACMAPGGLNTGGGEGGRIEERDWDGNLVWYLDYASSTYMMHHDFKVLPNGNIIMLVVEKKTYAEAITAGFNPTLLDTTISTDGFMLPDSVVEIDPTVSSGGTVVWEWHVWDHLIQDYDATKANYGVVAQHPELIDANGPGIKIPQFWNHFNGIDYNPALDQILLSARNQNEAWVIDHSTTTAQAAVHSGGAHSKGGDLLYRWGDPRMYDAGTVSNRMLYEQHNTQWIAAGLPGAGDIMVFNNGINRPAGIYSTIDEFTPPVDASGNYTLSTGAAYGPTALTWTYVASPPTSFYSMEISGVERLPNGNTLICEGLTGRIFEVTSARQIVWQYQNPVTDTGILDQGSSLPADSRGGYMTAVFRALKYPTTYGAFTGRTLTASGTVEVYPDWIELRNPGTSAVDLGGLYLTNDTSVPTKFQIPSGVSIPAGGYLVFWADNSTTAGSRHMNFTLDATGGTISLYDIDGITRIDTVTYGAQTTNVSSGRYPDGTGNWQAMTTATPGAANAATVNQAPTDVTLSTTTVAENLPAGTPVGTLTTTDPNTGNTFTYSLVSGTGSTDNASFTLSGSTLQTAASFDYETKNSYSIRIRSTDQGGLYFERIFTISVTLPNQSPVISGTSRNPAAPSATVPVWVTSTVTDDGSVSGVTLTYSTGSGSPTTTTVFTETMTATEVKPWTGTGAVNAWTVTGSYVEQRIGSNYGTGNACGLEYKGGLTLNALTDAMLTTTNAINAVGTAAYVEFWVQTLTLDATDGWTFQLDSGSGFVTRLSELSGSSHAWQQYRYDLTSTELVSTLKMRFQFVGGGAADDDRIDLDQITVTATSGGTTTNTVTMLDDGAHGDGAVGDHVYGGQIPGLASGTTVSYYVTATDNAGLVTTDPATAPSTKYSYTAGAAALSVNVVAASVAENAGATATTVTISRNSDTTAALTVNLSSSDTSEATVPATATIPAGQTSVTVNLAAVDDAIVDGTQTVTITAAATGFTSGSDTLQITDNEVATLVVNVAATSVAENAGAAATTVTISRNTDTTAALTVNLSSSDISEATVPATATIPASQASVTVNLAAVDDALVDGTQTLTITASAAGFVNGSDWLHVTDDDVPALTVDVLAATVAENAGAVATTVTISRNTDTTAALTVNLSSSDLSEATVAATATIPAGQASVTVNLAAVDDAVVDGIQTVTITAAAIGFTNGSDTLQVTDNEVSNRAPTDVSLTPQSVPENQPVGTVLGTLATVDPDPQNTFTYTLVSGPGDADNAAFRISGNQLSTAVSMDYELKSTYSIRVRTTDQGGLTFEKPLTVAVANVNESPRVVNPLANQTAPANRQFRCTLAQDTFMDPDVGQSLSYTASQADGSPLPKWLNFDGPTRTFSGRPLVRDVGQIHVRVTATDSGAPALAAGTEFSITVTSHPFAWQNADLLEDVDGNGLVTALDVLLVINWINGNEVGAVPTPFPDPVDAPVFFDVNGDNFISPSDVLAVINCINAGSSSVQQAAEGEGFPASAARRVTPVPPTEIADPLSLRGAAVDQAFRRAADLSTPDDWDELLGVLAGA